VADPSRPDPEEDLPMADLNGPETSQRSLRAKGKKPALQDDDSEEFNQLLGDGSSKEDHSQEDCPPPKPKAKSEAKANSKTRAKPKAKKKGKKVHSNKALGNPNVKTDRWQGQDSHPGIVKFNDVSP
jgi:hypothetical protein